MVFCLHIPVREIKQVQHFWSQHIIFVHHALHLKWLIYKKASPVPREHSRTMLEDELTWVCVSVISVPSIVYSSSVQGISSSSTMTMTNVLNMKKQMFIDNIIFNTMFLCIVVSIGTVIYISMEKKKVWTFYWSLHLNHLLHNQQVVKSMVL